LIPHFDNCLGLFKFLAFYAFSAFSTFLCFSGFSSSVWFFWFFAGLRHYPLLKLCFLLSFSYFLAFSEIARTKTTSNPRPKVDYRAFYPWASENLFVETSALTSSKDVMKHREDEVAYMLRVFEQECDAYVSVQPCVLGEPVCADERANDGKPFFFLYATIFKRIKLRFSLTGFERALLTEINVAPAQLHPNCLAFMTAFAILYNHFGHTPSVDIFLYFIEAKSLGKKLRVSFNGVAGRVLLSLFQQSYKGFKGKFFRVCCTDYNRTLLDGFPLYWVKKLEFKKPRTLEELTPHDRELCQVLASLGAVFNTAQLIKHEFSPSDLKGYIATRSPPSHFAV